MRNEMIPILQDRIGFVYSDPTFWENQLFAGVFLLNWLLYLLWRDNFRPRWGVTWNIKFTHLLPIFLQGVIISYWGLYNHAVYPNVPGLLLVALFGFLFDALLGITMQRRWVINAGPVPIAFSTFLFVWFSTPQFFWFFVVMGIGLAGKVLFVRDGRPIFNPSALGTAVIAVLWMLLGKTIHYQDIAFSLSLPPNMSETIFLVSLIPMLRLGLAPVTFGATLFMSQVEHFPALFGSSLKLPEPIWPGWFLAVTLFVTDPATASRTPLGRFIYGVFAGFVISLGALLLDLAYNMDFFAKVLLVPVANYCSHWFDYLGTTIESRLAGLTAWRPSPRFVKVGTTALWAGLYLWILFTMDKTGEYTNALTHWENATPHVYFTDAPKPTIDFERSPAWATPMSYHLEWRHWMSPKASPARP